MQEEIIRFCDNAEKIFCSSTNIDSLKELCIKINPKTDEIRRTRYNRDLSCIFDFELGLGDGKTLREEVIYMKTIEMFYPGLFSWRFTGEHIQAIALIPMKDEYLGIFGRLMGYTLS
jgi:hypothetical protein